MDILDLLRDEYREILTGIEWMKTVAPQEMWETYEDMIFSGRMKVRVTWKNTVDDTGFNTTCYPFVELIGNIKL